MSAIKTFNEFINESIWNSRPDISRGTFGAKKVITTNEDLQNRIHKLYEQQGEGDTLDVSSLTNLIKCDDFSYIFEGYRDVIQIIGLEDWDVSHVEDMSGMFADCYNFNSDLSKWDVSNVKDMRYMFKGCENFNSDLSKWDVSSVVDMSYMFYHCEKFNSDLSKWDVSNVVDMGGMFDGCESFNSNLSKWNVSNVEFMKGMFSYCREFNSDLSNWDVRYVKNMEHMFWYCYNFNSDLSKWNVSNVEHMKNMLDNCKSLKIIPSWYKNKGLNESMWSDMRDGITGGISYSTLKRKGCKVNLLYKYLIDNYEVLGDEQIKLNSDKYMGKVYYELEIPITLSGENIVTELTADDMQSIWSIDFTNNLMTYVEDMETVVEIDDENINSDGYSRAYTNTGLVLCSEVVDFIDEILTMVPDPALRKKRK